MTITETMALLLLAELLVRLAAEASESAISTESTNRRAAHEGRTSFGGFAKPPMPWRKRDCGRTRGPSRRVTVPKCPAGEGEPSRF
jgi:hypothetical protein